MPRIAVVTANTRPEWQSCISITENLLACYRSFPQVRIFECDPINLLKLHRVTNDVAKFDPDCIVFVDHMALRLVPTISALSVYLSKKHPLLLFHIYGNFISEPHSWSKIGSLIEGRRVEFVCASERQSKVFGSFLQRPRNHVSTCPFPVDTDSFHFDPKARSRMRLANRWKDALVFVYAGRISRSKNVIPLISRLSRIASKEERPFVIAVAGSFDVKPMSVFGDRAGWEQRELQSVLERLSPEIRSRIQLLGSLSRSSLNDLFCASDCFVSLSTNPYEDFGMAPSEAMATGLPALLTDWGGYSDLMVFSRQNFAIPTQIHQKQVVPDLKQITKGIRWIGKLKVDREAEAYAFQKYVSIQSVGTRIYSLVEKKLCENQTFEGFNKKLLLRTKYFPIDCLDEEQIASQMGVGTLHSQMAGTEL